MLCIRNINEFSILDKVQQWTEFVTDMDSLTFCISLISIYILTTILEVYHRLDTVMFFLVGSSYAEC